MVDYLLFQLWLHCEYLEKIRKDNKIAKEYPRIRISPFVTLAECR